MADVWAALKTAFVPVFPDDQAAVMEPVQCQSSASVLGFLLATLPVVAVHAHQHSLA